MKRAFFLLMASVAGALFADDSTASRVTITSQPPGAAVFVDGVEQRSVTPLVLFNLAPGRHHLKYRLAGYEERDRFVLVKPGERVDRNEVLEEERGLLLVKSDPPGCSIRADGVAVGETPRLLANLSTKDLHTIILTKAGYQDQVLSVKFNGREPIVREERLVQDSGVVNVISDPSGAQVMVNGITRGRTPLLVKDVPKGSAIVKLRLNGYREEMREIRLRAGDQQTLSVSLVGLPGTLHLISVPEGARFYVNEKTYGRSPVSIPGLPPGDYEVRCEKEGFGTVSRTVTIANGAAAREEFVLTSVMGRIEVRTSPPGAEILLDGRKVGVTKSVGENAEFSDIFAIENVLEGEHALVARRDGYHDLARTVKIQSKKTSRQHRMTLKRAFVPDVEVTTANGVFRGVFKSQNETTIVIETTPGSDYPIPRQFVRKVEYLTGK